MRPNTVSPSKLDIFLQCAKKYHFEYIDPEMAKIKKQIKKKRPVLEMGTFIHNSLTLFFRLPPEQRTATEMTSILKSVWAGPRGEKFGFKSVEEERDYYEQSLKMLNWFVKNEDLKPNIFNLPVSPPGNSFDDYKTTEFTDNLKIGGKLDRVDNVDDGTLEIIDYKTGKEKGDNLQLIMYTFLVEGIYGKKVSRATYIYLKSGRRVSVEPAEDLRAETKRHIIDTVDKIADTKEFKPNISKLCGYCDYLPFCPAKEEIKETLGIES